MAKEILDHPDWSRDVQARLNALITEPSSARPLAVFDWDDTIVEGDISLTMLRAMDAEHGTRWYDEYFERLASRGRADAYPQILRWFTGWTTVAFGEYARALVARALDEGLVTPRPAMLALLQTLRAHDWDIWVVTASAGALVAAMAERLGLDPARVIGLRLRVDLEGRMTHDLDGPATFSDGKAEVVWGRIGRRPDLVAGDSSSDAPMMRIARHALLIDGHDATLHAEAIERGWMIQSGWHHTPAEPGVVIHAR